MRDDLTARTARLGLLVILLAGLGLRLGTVWLVSPSPPVADEVEYLFRSIGADIYVTDNQGETTLSRTLEALRDEGMSGLSSVGNLVYSTDLKTFHHTARATESNPLETNTIDWSGFDRDLFTPTTYMRTARSCPFTCAGLSLQKVIYRLKH